MKESAEAALTYVRANQKQLGVKSAFRYDVHVHVPEGAIPKDGPSAGLTIAAALASAYTQRPIKAGYAMTGEVTLRGRVLPIGGLKEKLLAALRAGIKTVLIPSENEKDLADIPDNVRKGLNIIPVATVDQVLAQALVRMPVPVTWVEPTDEPARPPATPEAGDHDTLIAH